jgi:hypothetical protein
MSNCELIATINRERMPVLLTGDEECETSLMSSPAEAFTLIRRYPADALRSVQAGLEKDDLLAG